MVENNKNKFLKILGYILIIFLTAFLAFYLAMIVALKQVFNPIYQAKQFDKFIQKQERNFRKFEHNFIDRPYVPRFRSRLVNLIKEDNEYKILVDLKPFDKNENAIKFEINDNYATVSGKIDKKENRKEEIINFSQSYYLNEQLLTDRIVKEKNGDKYIITIPFNDK